MDSAATCLANPGQPTRFLDEMTRQAGSLFLFFAVSAADLRFFEGGTICKQMDSNANASALHVNVSSASVVHTSESSYCVDLDVEFFLWGFKGISMVRWMQEAALGCGS